MIRHYVKVKLVLAVLAGLLTLPLPSFGAEKIWGSYENKIDGDKVTLSIFPIGADEKSGKVSVVFDLVEKSGKDLEISGVGTIKEQTVTLYNRIYRLTVTVGKGKADFLVEESCGGHRFYEGYSYYNETCSLQGFKSFPRLSKGLKKK